jgi:hypothetical protein
MTRRRAHRVIRMSHSIPISLVMIGQIGSKRFIQTCRALRSLNTVISRPVRVPRSRRRVRARACDAECPTLPHPIALVRPRSPASRGVIPAHAPLDAMAFSTATRSIASVHGYVSRVCIGRRASSCVVARRASCVDATMTEDISHAHATTTRRRNRGRRRAVAIEGVSRARSYLRCSEYRSRDGAWRVCVTREGYAHTEKGSMSSCVYQMSRAYDAFER